MKNQILKAIPSAAFLRLVIEATNTFKKIYEKGDKVKGTDSGDALSGVKTAIANAGIGKELSDAIVNMLNVAVGGEKASRKPTQEEIDKQFLTFVPYACVVPLRNRNHHAYTIGEPVIMIHGAEGANSEMFGLDKNGCIIAKSATARDGISHLPRLRKSIRPATSSEIMRLVDKLYA